MEIDTAEAARFLTALTGEAMHTFQTFADRKDGRKGLSRILHGTFQARAKQLAALNERGAGVFVMVNRGDGMGRKADNVTGCRALFLDLDGSPLEPVLKAPIPPRIVVESSPGKWHAYWPVVDLPPSRFTAAQKQLAERFAGDPKVHDRPRVMRLPGFIHGKDDPFVSRLVTCENAPLTWSQMVEAFGFADRMTLPGTIAEGERNATIFKLARSAASKGVPEAVQLEKALRVNETRCVPALPDSEVAATVASAYSTPRTEAACYPRALLDSPAFLALDDSARMLLLLAYLRADKFNEGCITLTWRELATWFPREKTFNEIRKRSVSSGLLTVAQPATKAMPKKGRGPTPNFYRLAIPPVSAPYSNDRIPPVSAPPEAFQGRGNKGDEGDGATETNCERIADASARVTDASPVGGVP